ncbi:MAG TPA: YceI family protein [Burkholderiales bacterium]|nr:YceI family protein [Burkholderiales bacterium]
MRALIAAVSIACWLSACAPISTAPAVAPSVVPSGFPAANYLAAAARAEPVFRLDAERSLVVIRVYRAGALARFGHDHVVASRDVRGYVLLSSAAGARRVDVYAPLASLSVDEPALRAQAGFDTQPSQQDVEGTRRNMLEKVLEADQYPFVSIHIDRVAGESPAITVDAAVTLHGITRTLPLAVELEIPSAQTIYARGRFSAKLTDFSITPYSLLGGALRVEDRLDIEFEIAATRVSADAILN